MNSKLQKHIITSLTILLLFKFLNSCGQVPEGTTDTKIDCIDGCSPEVSPTPIQTGGCVITEIETGSVITCGDKQIVIQNVSEDADEISEPSPSPAPSTAGTNTIIIYKCKNGKK